MAADNNEATAWNNGLGGGDSQPPADNCATQRAKDKMIGAAMTAVGTAAGFVAGVIANSDPRNKR